MKPIIKIAAFILITGLVIFISCKKETSCEDCATKNNKPPIAVAGPDQVITLPTDSVLLNGSSSSDPDGTISSYLWTKISGPVSFTINTASASRTVVKNIAVGLYQFELKVTDDGGLSAKDTVQVIVENTIQTSCPFQQTFIGTIPYRSSFAIATAGNKIVFAGGYEIGNPNVASSRVDIFDMGTQTWSGVNLTNNSFVTMAVGDKIYFVSSSIVDIYNTTDNSWSSTQLNGTNQSFSVVKVGTKILILDDPNYSSGSWSTKVHIYDLSFSSGSVVDIQHPLYVVHAFGNKAIFEADSSFDIYDASSNSWSTHPIGENYRYWSAATLGNKIYLAGGYDYGGNNFTSNVHIYDAVSNAWSSTTMSQPKSGIRSVGAGGKIFWAGGYDSIWVYGTEDQERYVNDIEIYDVTTGVHSHHNIVLDDMLYGGYGVANSHVLFRSPLSNELHIYNINSETWSICTANLGWYVQSISIGNAIYVAGAVGTSPVNLTVWKLEF